jgi:hypothetical protein
MHLGTAPYAAARGEHLSQHYVVAACHDLELMDNVWLSHTCVDAVTLCNE